MSALSMKPYSLLATCCSGGPVISANDVNLLSILSQKVICQGCAGADPREQLGAQHCPSPCRSAYAEHEADMSWLYVSIV